MNLRDLRGVLQRSVRGRVEQSWPLARLTTYRLGGPASIYFEPVDAGDLRAFARVLKDAAPDADEVPILVLGRGSNVVVSDNGFPGVVVRMGPSFAWIESSGEATDAAPVTRIRVGASTPLPLVANWAARRGLSGVEFTVAIPGSMGGAVRMNAGAHGREIGDCLGTVRAFDLDVVEIVERAAPDLGLRYRASSLTDRDVVVDAELRLEAGDRDAIKQRMEDYRRHRATTQPGAVHNAGSVFKNPPGDAAGRLVEAAGLKGFRVGGASVSEIHANFFIAGADASAQDVYDLVQAVRASVLESFDVLLEPEIRFAGPFEERVGALSR